MAVGNNNNNKNNSNARVTPLQAAYTFSFMRRGKAAQPPPGVGGRAAAAAGGEGDPAKDAANAAAAAAAGESKEGAAAAAVAAPNPYENSIKAITTVHSVESFWATYDYLKRPNDLPTTTDYHFFRAGIKPTWEDPSNCKGGKWIVRLPKGLASRYWEEIILACIGQQFLGIPTDEICGAVLSIRYNEDILGIWNKNSHDREMVDKIRDSIKKILQLPPHANMEYKPHQTSLADRSSFRNTQVWKPKGERTSSVSGGGPPGVGAPSLDRATTAEGHAPMMSSSRRSGSWGERGDGGGGGDRYGESLSSSSRDRSTATLGRGGPGERGERPRSIGGRGGGRGGGDGGNAWRT